MNEHINSFVDQNQREDLLGRLYYKKGFNERAIEHYEAMLELNQSNYDIYYKILSCKGVKLFDERGDFNKLSSDEKQILFSTISYYQKKFSKVDAHIRIAMKWIDGDDFSNFLGQYVKPLLIKGAPSVIQDLKEFYNDTEKVQRIEALLLGYLKCMENKKMLEENDK